MKTAEPMRTLHYILASSSHLPHAGVSRAVVLNLWVTAPSGSQIRYPVYQIFKVGFIKVAKLQL